MATDQQAKDAGFWVAHGSESLRTGDNAIAQNARAAVEFTNGVRMFVTNVRSELTNAIADALTAAKADAATLVARTVLGVRDEIAAAAIRSDGAYWYPTEHAATALAVDDGYYYPREVQP